MILIFIIVSILVSSCTFGQIANLKCNLSGKYLLICNDLDEEIIETSSNTVTKINLCDTFEIEFIDNESTIIYRFCNVQFSENDTISLNFIHYYRADTINYVSGCIDGTESKSTIEIIEFNKESQPINQLPEKISIKINSKELDLKRKQEEFVSVNSGNGKKFGKNWGYSKKTFSKRIIYSN